MANPKARTVEENLAELRSLKATYEKLPDHKKAAQRPWMQKRMTELQNAINDKNRKGGADFSLLQTALLVVLVGVVALGLGFFGVTYLAKGG